MLLFVTILVVFLKIISTNSIQQNVTNSLTSQMCTSNLKVDHGFVEVDILSNSYHSQILKVHCSSGYDLSGSSRIHCINGHWQYKFEPQCLKRCQSPPFVSNSAMEIVGHRDSRNTFGINTVVTYKCGTNYNLHPDYSGVHVCENGDWNGTIGICLFKNSVLCGTPPTLKDGYWEKQDYDLGLLNVGQRVQYVCKKGYHLQGDMLKSCSKNGSWIPSDELDCIPNNLDGTSNDISWCPRLEDIPHAVINLIHGFISPENGAMSSTVLEVKCANYYRDTSRSMCGKSIMQCNNGAWEGIVPHCVKTNSCNPPPVIENGVISEILLPKVDDNEEFHVFPIGTQIIYKCIQGYMLIGTNSFTCNNYGCWEPETGPICENLLNNYKPDLVVPTLLGIALMLLLIVICVVIVTKQKKIFQRRRSQSVSRTVNTLPGDSNGSFLPTVNSTSNLIQNPDRLALIAFADGLHVGQSILPTYEEAVSGVSSRQNVSLNPNDFYNQSSRIFSYRSRPRCPHYHNNHRNVYQWDMNNNDNTMVSRNLQHSSQNNGILQPMTSSLDTEVCNDLQENSNQILNSEGQISDNLSCLEIQYNFADNGSLKNENNDSNFV